MGKLKRKKAPTITGEVSRYLTPMDYYVQHPDQPSIAATARAFGMSVSNMEAKSSKEGWVAKREAYWAKVRAKVEKQMADESAEMIVRANREHIKTGQAWRALSGEIAQGTIARYRDPETRKELRIGEGLRVATQMMKTGVEVERKGLGLADTTVYVQNVREFAEKAVRVLEKVLQGHPDLMEACITDLADLLQGAEDELAEVAAGVGKVE